MGKNKPARPRAAPASRSANAPLALLWRTAVISHAIVGNTTLGRYIIFLTILVLAERELAPSVMHLVAATGLTKAGVSRSVQDLMNDGLLREEIDPADRRLRRLHPTPKALRIAENLIRESRAAWSRVAELDADLGPWRNADAATLDRMLARFQALGHTEQ